MSKLYTNRFCGHLILTPCFPVKKELNISFSGQATLEFKLHPIDLDLFKEYPSSPLSCIQERNPFIDTSHVEVCLVIRRFVLQEQQYIWKERYLRDSYIRFNGSFTNIVMPSVTSYIHYKTEIDFLESNFVIRNFEKDYCLTTTIPSKDVKELLIPECKRMSES